MNAFEYAAPTSVQEAVALLGSEWGQTEVLAGGTDLLSLIKDGISSPKRVVNIKCISGLDQIKATAQTISIGALVRLEQLIEHAAVRRSCPSLVQAAEAVASPQLLAMGTVGGDLCQRPRCWYYRAGFGLLATGPDGQPLVPKGDNRYHAVFGGGPAWFVSPSSLAPALVALGAELTLVGPDGARKVAVADFFQAPKTAQQRENVLAPNEILTEVSIPVRGLANATYEVRERQILDWPLATASVALELDGDVVKSATIVLGQVAPTPWLAKVAGQALAGKRLTETAAEAAGKAATQGAKPLSRNGYKLRLVQTAVKRALLSLART